MRLDDSAFKAKAKTLGVGSALILVSGYRELAGTGDLTPRRACWFLPMFFFLEIVYECLVGLSATEQEPDKVVRYAIQSALLVRRSVGTPTLPLPSTTIFQSSTRGWIPRDLHRNIPLLPPR